MGCHKSKINNRHLGVNWISLLYNQGIRLRLEQFEDFEVWAEHDDLNTGVHVAVIFSMQ